MIPSIFERVRLATLPLLGILLFGLQPAAAVASQTVYVGTYTGGESKGIYALDFDPATGAASNVRLVTESANPSFLALNPDQNRLYAVNELNEVNGLKGGGLTAYKIEAGGGLTLLNQVSTFGEGPCHLSISQNGRTALVANYGGGSTVSYQLNADGSIGNRVSFLQHEGAGVDPGRQQGPHAHGVYLIANDSLALVPDLGLDKVMIYSVEPETAVLHPASPAFARLTPGSGPRHLAVHPNGNLVLVLNEMKSTITTFALDPKTGGMKPLATVSTLPSDFTGNNSTAEIFIHPGGRFAYASNRGHDSIAVFEINATTGELKAVGHTSTRGRTPRNFNLDPSGKWLLAANQNSGTIAVFAIDPVTGLLTPKGDPVAVPSPVCLVFTGR